MTVLENYNRQKNKDYQSDANSKRGEVYNQDQKKDYSSVTHSQNSIGRAGKTSDFKDSNKLSTKSGFE